MELILVRLELTSPLYGGPEDKDDLWYGTWWEEEAVILT